MYKGFDLQLSRNDSMEFMGISSQDIKNYSDKIDSLCLKTKLLQKVNSNIVAVELGHHIFDPCSKFIANLIGLTLEFSQN